MQFYSSAHALALAALAVSLVSVNASTFDQQWKKAVAKKFDATEIGSDCPLLLQEPTLKSNLTSARFVDLDAVLLAKLFAFVNPTIKFGKVISKSVVDAVKEEKYKALWDELDKNDVVQHLSKDAVAALEGKLLLKLEEKLVDDQRPNLKPEALAKVAGEYLKKNKASKPLTHLNVKQIEAIMAVEDACKEITMDELTDDFKLEKPKMKAISARCFADMGDHKSDSITDTAVAMLADNIFSLAEKTLADAYFTGATDAQIVAFCSGRPAEDSQRCNNLKIDKLSAKQLRKLTFATLRSFLDSLPSSSTVAPFSFNELNHELFANMTEADVELMKKFGAVNLNKMTKKQAETITAKFPELCGELDSTFKLGNLTPSSECFGHMTSTMQSAYLLKANSLPVKFLEYATSEKAASWELKSRTGVLALVGLSSLDPIKFLGSAKKLDGDHPCAAIASKTELIQEGPKHTEETPEYVIVKGMEKFVGAMGPHCFSSLPFRTELKEAELKLFPAYAFALCDEKTISAYAPDFYATMDSETFTMLATEKFCETLTMETLEKINVAALAGMPAACFNSLKIRSKLTAEQLHAIPAAAFRLAEAKHVSDLADLSLLTPEQIAELSADVAETKNNAASRISAEVMAKLSAAQIAALTANHVVAIPVASFASIKTKEQLVAFTPASLVFLTNDKISQIAPEVLANLTVAQIQSLGISVTVAENQPKKSLTDAVIEKMSKDSRAAALELLGKNAASALSASAGVSVAFLAALLTLSMF